MSDPREQQPSLLKPQEHDGKPQENDGKQSTPVPESPEQSLASLLNDMDLDALPEPVALERPASPPNPLKTKLLALAEKKRAAATSASTWTRESVVQVSLTNPTTMPTFLSIVYCLIILVLVKIIILMLTPVI
jgi:hypothetical protein